MRAFFPRLFRVFPLGAGWAGALVVTVQVAFGQQPTAVDPGPVPLSVSSLPGAAALSRRDVPKLAQSPQSPPGRYSDTILGTPAPAASPIQNESPPLTTPGSGFTPPSPTLAQPPLSPTIAPTPSPPPSNPPANPTDFNQFSSPPTSALANSMTSSAQAGGGSQTLTDIGNYIDSAIIRSRIRVRYDNARGLNSPDMAEFFYAKCGCFKLAGIDPHAKGPTHAPFHGLSKGFTNGNEPRINYQEQSTYLEYAASKNFSAFVEAPVRFINPELVRNFQGVSDLNFGFKYALIAEPDQYLTFQTRVYTPTGAANHGLGTGHYTIEPALLLFEKLSDRLFLTGEFRDWTPIGGSNFAGNILRYGLGLAYNIVLTDHYRIAPVNEVVGWTILNGAETNPLATNGVKNVAGETIVNEKIGIRFGIGDYNQEGGGSQLNDHHTLSVSYGHAITGDHWYKDVLRVEYDFWF